MMNKKNVKGSLDSKPHWSMRFYRVFYKGPFLYFEMKPKDPAMYSPENVFGAVYDTHHQKFFVFNKNNDVQDYLKECFPDLHYEGISNANINFYQLRNFFSELNSLKN